MQELAEHLRKCEHRGCAPCLFIRNVRRWRQQFPWLQARRHRTDDGVSVGCKPCSMHGVKTKFGMRQVKVQGSFRKCVLCKHANSPSHKSAEAAMARNAKLHVATGEAPEPGVWVALLELLRRGVATARKQPRETFCVSEAINAFH